MVEISITDKQHVGLKTDVFNSLSKSVLEAAHRKDLSGDLALVFVDDAEIQRLNDVYRKKNSPTDVLSFSYLDEIEEETIGEIIISVDTAKRQAEEQGHELSTEIQILFVHGMLHVLGYDHEEISDKVKMTEAEKAVLGEKAGLIERST